MKKIVIVGGGTAGLMAALILKFRFQGLQVDLIKSSNNKIIGVGESSTEHWNDFIRFCLIKPEELIKETGATFKFGVKFEDWINKDYFHSVTGLISSMKFGQYFSGYAHTIIKNIKNEDYVCKEVLDSKIIDNNIPNQYHFDTFKLNKFLIKKCNAMGVNIIEDDLINIDVKNNNIKKLRGNKKEYVYDFYIDCTGFKKLLISKLGVKWNSYKEYLPLNEAIAFQTPDTDEYPLYTLSKKLKHGWLWRIPVQGRWGNGYVFDNTKINAEEAKQECEQLLKTKIDIANNIKFEAGALDKAWVGNCVAMGLSSNFIEPLEASSIAMTIQQSFLLMHMLVNYSSKDVELYNKRFNLIVENIKDFVCLHYYHENKMPDSLLNKLETWKDRLPIEEDFQGGYYVFNPHNFIVLLKEYGLVNKENIEKEYKLLNVDLRNIVLDNYFKYKTYYLNDKKTGHKEFIQQILDGKRVLY